MTTKKEMLAKAEKIKAYKELLKMAQKEASDNLVGLKSGMGCLGPILSMNRTEDQQAHKNYMRKLMCNLIDRHRMDGLAVKNSKEIEAESRVIQLALTSGADPNCTYPYGISSSKAIFDAFIDRDKFHGALLVAKAPGFTGPENQYAFLLLSHYLRDAYKWEFPGKAEMPYARELVYVLFSKGMKPYNPKILQSLQPIYEAEKKTRENASRPAGNTPTGGRSGASR